MSLDIPYPIAASPPTIMANLPIPGMRAHKLARDIIVFSTAAIPAAPLAICLASLDAIFSTRAPSRSPFGANILPPAAVTITSLTPRFVSICFNPPSKTFPDLVVNLPVGRIVPACNPAI